MNVSFQTAKKDVFAPYGYDHPVGAGREILLMRIEIVCR